MRGGESERQGGGDAGRGAWGDGDDRVTVEVDLEQRRRRARYFGRVVVPVMVGDGTRPATYHRIVGWTDHRRLT